MKTEFKAMMFGVSFFIAIYLIGSFAMASFNISTWPEAGRAFAGVLGGGLGIVITIASYNIMKEDE